MTKTVQLHKDKHMRDARADDKQPIQLDLWQMYVSETYSNSLALYQSLPDVYSWKQSRLRNPDGSLPALSRKGKFDQLAYSLDISPAQLTVIEAETNKKIKKAYYKTLLAEIVEEALHKLSVEEWFFLKQDDVKTEEFGLITTFYKIRQQLKRAWKNYSYEQIRQWISILAGLRYELSWDISKSYGLDSFFSPIDLIIKNDRKNPLHSELYITFNKLISKKILAIEWRGFNYYEYMKVKSILWRRFFMRLCHRFKQVDAIKGYHILLSTLIEDGDIQEDALSNCVRDINKAMAECSYIISSYTLEKKGRVKLESWKTITDYLLTVFPTAEFQQEQWRINTHQKNLKNHRIDQTWKPVIKPLRDQYKTWLDYDRYVDDCDKFEKAVEQTNN